MKYGPLTSAGIIRGKAGTIFNRLRSRQDLQQQLHGYNLLRDVTPVYSSVRQRVGIYSDGNGKRVVMKRCTFTAEDLNAVYLKNEAYVLQILSGMRTQQQLYPRFVRVICSENQVCLITEPAEGEKLNTAGPDLRSLVIQKTYSGLRELSAQLERNNFFNLPVRKPLNYLISFPFNLIKVIVKDPANSLQYLKLGVLFYRNYAGSVMKGTVPGFSHRDLYADNILYDASTGRITLLDWESAAVTDSLYDLAQIAMIYAGDFGTEKLVAFLREYLHTSEEKHRFTGLSLFNSIQILANNKPADPVFKETSGFLKLLLTEIQPRLF